ncbi:hypothetical protein VULLAG_LOCUS2174 [Vulpes lagopus]
MSQVGLEGQSESGNLKKGPPSR